VRVRLRRVQLWAAPELFLIFFIFIFIDFFATNFATKLPLRDSSGEMMAAAWG
jgi:hypothetical protein